MQGRRARPPSGWRSLPSALRHIKVSDDDVFLDLGCGKGRVVLQAAERPFKRVIGVELSPELIAVAQENLHAIRDKLRCQDVELIQADITTWAIPDDYPREHDVLASSGRFDLLHTITSWRPRRSWASATAINIYAAGPAHELQG